MQQQILFCYPFFRIGQWEFTPSCIFVLFFLIAFPIAHLNIWQKSNQKDCFSDFTYVIHLRKIWADIVLRRKTLQLLGAYVFCFMLYWLRPSVGNIDLEKHWLFAFADYYLHYESLLSLIIVFLSMGTILINSGKEQYVRVLNHVVVFYFIISAACMQITRQLRWGWSVPTLAVLFGLSVMLETCDVIGKHTNESLPNTTFLPIERYDQLFELRQVQADELRELIIGSADEPISICVSGDWGSGKTSLVNGALAELKKCEGCGDNYEIIRVNALELDSLQSLKTYMFQQIRRILKLKGSYVGTGSEYQKFLAATAGVISHSQLPDMVGKLFGPPTLDYRDERKSVEKVLSDALGTNGRLIIVVDDVERCDAKKALEFVFFVKEIVSMKQCITIFITEYGVLKNIAEKYFGECPEIFFDKFFNYRLAVSEIEAETVLKDVEKTYSFWDKIDSTFKKPSEIFERQQKRIQGEIERASKTQKSRFGNGEELYPKLKQRQENAQLYREQLSNPRSVVKICDLMKKYENHLNALFANIESTERIAYFRKLQIDELLFYLAYVEVVEVNPSNKDRNYFEQLCPEQNPLATSLGKGLLFECPIQDKDRVYAGNYLEAERLAFVEYFFKNPKQITNIATPYASELEEWTEKLNAGKPISKDDWNECIDKILCAYCYLNPADSPEEADKKIEAGKEYIQKLFLIAKQWLIDGTWSPKDMLAFVSHNRNNELWVSGQVSIMEELCDILMPYLVPSTQIANQLELFSVEYVSHRISHFTQLLYYVVPAELNKEENDDEILQNAADAVFKSDKTVEERIEKYLSELERLTAIPMLPKERSAFDRLESLAVYLREYLEKNGYVDYLDVSRTLRCAEISMKDLRCFNKLILLATPTKEPKEVLSDAGPGHVFEAIVEIGRFLTTPQDFSESSIRDRMRMLFGQIRETPDLYFTPEQYDKLQDTLTIYYQKTGASPAKYRKILAEHKCPE